jgi:Zn-dependent protease with chaperone function
MRRHGRAAIIVLLTSGAIVAQLKTLKPGWDLFSPQQDVQLGQEAKKQVEQQQPVVHDARITTYLQSLGQRLARSPHAGDWPFSFEAINDKNINAFALPGGPIFVNTATIIAADNEAQLAGVMAHEMSHIVLRHGTHQATKAQAIQLPAAIAGAVLGGGMLGQLGRMGIGLGANSLLLHYSRDAESQADYNGTEIMAEAGFNPVEMARFFEKLQSQGSEGRLAQFLSDHPTPGNRVKAVEEELQYIPQRKYSDNITGQFAQIRDYVRQIPPPAKGAGTGARAPAQSGSIQPSGNFRSYQAQDWQISYPDNWEVLGDQRGQSVTIAPRAGLVQGSNGGVGIGYGVTMSYYQPNGNKIDLARDTDALIQQLKQQNPSLQQASNVQRKRIAGTEATETRFSNNSPFQGQRETDVLLTVPRPQGLFYLIFIAPESEASSANNAFQTMLQSLRFAQS